jgi:hypothetical protein
MRRLVTAAALAVCMAVVVTLGQRGAASGGDFSLDFTAAAPFTYDHDTGGGAYNDRTVGKFNDIVESLEGGDFACADIVTYLTQIRVDAAAVGTQTIRLVFEFTAHSTGQQGVALVDNDVVSRGMSAAINIAAIDSGTTGDGGSTATVVPGSEVYDGLVFTKPTHFFRSVDVTDLEAGETVVLRTDVAIDCDGSTPGASPTGNMQARLVSATVIAPTVDPINAGDQTIPFKKVGLIKK